MLKNFWESLVKAFIDFHTMGFELIGYCVRDYNRWGLGHAVIDLLLGILLIVAFLVTDAVFIYYIYRLIRRITITMRTKETKYYSVSGTVIDKVHHPARTTYTITTTGRCTICTPHRHPEKHIVKVKYRDMTEGFDSKSLYERTNVNDNIKLILIHKLDRNNKIIEATLELPK